MNSTKSKVEVTEESEMRRHLTFDFELTSEDYSLALESLDYMNSELDRDDDLADHLLSLLTWAIHKAYEERTGKPFVLRMDRPKN